MPKGLLKRNVRRILPPCVSRGRKADGGNVPRRTRNQHMYLSLHDEDLFHIIGALNPCGVCCVPSMSERALRPHKTGDEEKRVLPPARKVRDGGYAAALPSPRRRFCAGGVLGWLINNVNLAKNSCDHCSCLLFNDERIIRRRPAGRDVSIRLVE